MPLQNSSNRREFLGASSLAAGAALLGGLNVARSAHAGSDDTLKVGLVGCGGRGTAAARLVGCVRTLEERLHFPRTVSRQDAYDLLHSSLAQQLSAAALVAATSDGARLTPDEAIAEALAGLESTE